MRNNIQMFIFFVGVTMLAGCGTNTSPSATAETATVQLTDGTTFQGTVTKSDTSSITVQASNSETRSYPMSQVISVKYASLPPVSQNEPFSPAAPVVSGNTPDGSVPRPPMIPEPMHTIRGGTSLRVRTTGTISADAAAVGQTFHAVLIGNVLSDDSKVAIPRGSEAMLVVRAVKGQGDIRGRSELSLDLDSVTVDGRRYQLGTDNNAEQGKQRPDENKRSAKFVGGALTGTITSAVAGGGNDAVIGSASGTGAGLASQPVVRGSSISIPADSILTFRLESRVEVQPE